MPEGPPLLRPGETCWRTEPAERIAFLIDGAAYYDALIKVMAKARHSIMFIGWDADPWVPLRPGRRPEDDKLRFGRFLKALAARNPDLQVKVLKWRTALPVAVQYPSIPMPLVDLAFPRRVRWKADGSHPPGATHHQKVVVVDDAVAFCGGMDVARDRFDTPDHPDDDPRRRTPMGRIAQPHHDVMIMVDGDAARALGDLARERWRKATGEHLAPPRPSPSLWPEDLAPDVLSCRVGISRTEPEWKDWSGAREIEALYLTAIAQAEHSIYIENQYLASAQVAAALADRLREPKGPCVVLVLPERSPSYFDKAVMDPVRDRAVARLRTADSGGRLGIYAPYTSRGTPIINHSKVMICDDRLAVVGSANLNNRSLFLDTECAVGLEAPRDSSVAAAIAAFRTRLLADHLGMSREHVAAVAGRSLLEFIESSRGQTGRLRPLRVPPPGEAEDPFALHHLLDPRRPEPILGPWLRARNFARRRPWTTAAAVGAVGAAGLAWWLRKRN